MRSKPIHIAILALLFALAPPASAEGDKDAFDAAYQAYQEAVEAGDAEATATAAGEALELGKSMLADDSASLAALYVNHGTALLNTKRFKQAIEPLEKAVRRYEALYGKDDERLVDPLWWLVQAGGGIGRNDDQVSLARRLLRLVGEARGKDSLLYADASIEAGKAYYVSSKKRSRAARHFRDAYNIYQRNHGQSAYKVGVAAFWRGKAAVQRRRAKAEKYFLEALQIFEETAPPPHELQLLTHAHMVWLYEDRARSDEATLHCQAISRIRPLAGVDGARPLYEKAPRYPPDAEAVGREGSVLVEFSVTTQGRVANASVVESQGGKDFEQAALKAAARFRYAPAVLDGELVETAGVRHLIVFDRQMMINDNLHRFHQHRPPRPGRRTPRTFPPLPPS